MTNSSSNDTGGRFSQINTGTERLALIFGDNTELERTQRFKAGGGTQVKGDPISPDMAATLIERGFVDPDDREYDAPTAQSLVNTATEYNDRTPPSVDAQLAGYVIPASRADARITFDAIRLDSDSGNIAEETQEDFLEEFKHKHPSTDTYRESSACYAR